MKLFTFFIFVFALTGIHLHSNEEAWDVSLETYSAQKILQMPEYQVLHEIEKDFHKTVIRFHAFPIEDTYLLKYQRPILKREVVVHEISREQLLANLTLIPKEGMHWWLVSNGFLPGEPVILWLETKNGHSKSSPLAFVPQPLIFKDTKSAAQVEAIMDSPTHYFLSFKGFKDGESLKLISISSGEEIEKEITFHPGIGCGYSPKREGINSGTAKISVIREEGKSVDFSLPWGLELAPHLQGKAPPVESNFESITSENRDFK